MGRSPCCDENGLKKGPWTPEEDQKLVDHIQKHGHGSWRALPKLAGLNRCGKSCRLRWTNYLRPDIKRGKFSQEEEQTILHLHSILGNKWSAIATHLPGRTDNEIKNFWNTHLKKRLIQMGFDPMTHQPRTDLFSTLPYLLALANITDFMDHHQSFDEHSLRLQLEALQLAKIQQLNYLLQSTTTTTTTNNNNNNNNNTNNNSLLSNIISSSINTNNNSYDQNNNSITDMEAFNLLNSITNNNVKENNPVTTFSHDEIIADSSSQPLHQSSNMLLPHLLDPQPQVSLTSSQSSLNSTKLDQGITNNNNNNNNDLEVMGSEGDYHMISPWNIITSLSSSSSSSSSPASSSVPLNASSSNTSSYGGTSSYWPELFYGNPIMHDELY